MATCSRCGADSNHLNDAGVCASEFPNGWVDRVKEGDRFRVSRSIPAAWLEQSTPPSPSYTLAELIKLAEQWRDENEAEVSDAQWVVSHLFAWLAQREQGKGDGQ